MSAFLAVHRSVNRRPYRLQVQIEAATIVPTQLLNIREQAARPGLCRSNPLLKQLE